MTQTYGMLQIKDGGGGPRDVRAIDESGTGVGPWRIISFASIEGVIPAYSAGFTVAGYASPTDIVALSCSGSKLVKIRRISISGRATAATALDVQLVKRSSLNTSGTPTSITITPNDSNDASTTATLVKYGTAPTTGTLVGAIRYSQLALAAAGSVSFAPPLLVWEFGNGGSKPPFIRGNAEMLAINLPGGSLPSGMSLSVDIELTEE